MLASTARRAAAAVALLAAAALAGCHDHRRNFDDDPEVLVTVHNRHGGTIYIELIDDHDNVINLGTIRDGREVVLGLDDAFIGDTLRARDASDDDTLDIEFAYDGLHWDVF